MLGPRSVWMRRFTAPWTVESIPGGFKVVDANGQSLAYVYSRKTKDAADLAGVLTEDEARHIAANIAKLPVLLGQARPDDEAGGHTRRPSADGRRTFDVLLNRRSSLAVLFAPGERRLGQIGVGVLHEEQSENFMR
jgi:hypothetical protein